MFTYENNPRETLSWQEYIDLGLSGRDDSSSKREIIAKHYYLGKPNAKTLYKRLNMLHLTKETLEAILEDKKG